MIRNSDALQALSTRNEFQYAQLDSNVTHKHTLHALAYEHILYHARGFRKAYEFSACSHESRFLLDLHDMSNDGCAHDPQTFPSTQQ